MRQTQGLVEGEKGGETYKLLRSRARPKVLLASSWEEAVSLFERYEPYILTVITDLSFPRGGRPDSEAGSTSCAWPGQDQGPPRHDPVERAGSREKAAAVGAAFADKDSESLEHELGDFLRDSLGFGPFRFRRPDGAAMAQAATMDEFIAALAEVPREIAPLPCGAQPFFGLADRAGRDRVREGPAGLPRSPISRLLPRSGASSSASSSGARKDKSRGSDTLLRRGAFRDEDSLTRLGDGSVGGKGRGIVFIRSLLDNLDFGQYLDGW